MNMQTIPVSKTTDISLLLHKKKSPATALNNLSDANVIL